MEPGSFMFNDSFACRGKGNMLVLRDTDSLLRGPRRSFMGLGESESLRKRPFSKSPEEMFCDEFYDGQSPEKKRRLSADQVCLLEKAFEAEIKLEPDRKKELAKKMGLPPRQIAIWFQNRRARWRTKQLEQGYDHLKSSYESLLIKWDCILKDNEKLRSEVLSLNERLHHVISSTNEETLIKAEEGHSTGSDIIDEESLWPAVDVSECDIIDMVRAESHGSVGDGPDWCRECNVFGGQQEPTIGWWA